VRTWLIGCSLLALVTGFTPPAWTGDLNDIFSFPSAVYIHDPATGLIEGHGEGGQFEGMGDISFTLRFFPDPEGGHPLGRHIRFEGVIPELGIDEETSLSGGLLIEGPFIHDRATDTLFGFTVLLEESHPALGLGRDFESNWNFVIPHVVSAPAAGLLLGLGGVTLTAWRWRRRS
jgi:hypothetical protein